MEGGDLPPRMNAAACFLPRRSRRTSAGLGVAILVSAVLAACTASAQTVYRAAPDNYRHLLTLLQPGDTLALSAGEYRDGLVVHNLSGAPDRPITISGPPRGPSATFVARPGHNTVSIVESHYLVIRDLALEGNNLPVDAVKAEKPSRSVHDITLENLVIHGHGNNQQTVGISTKCPSWNWVIRGNTIIGAGTGIYLGDSDGSAPFVAGLIERNLIVDTIGYNLQVKHQQPRPDIPGMPGGRSTTIIRHNVFAKPDGDWTEAPRPNVLVGHFPLEGAGAEDDYAIYGNFFYQNRLEALFQGEGNVALYDNLFVNAFGDAIRIQPHNDIPRRIVIAFNTVVAKGAGISLIQKEGAPRYPQTVGANAVFAGIPIRGGRQIGNFSAPVSEAEAFLRRPFGPLGQVDLYPKRVWPRAISTKSLPSAPFPDWEQDFNGRPRRPGAIGAYGASGANPGWMPQLERKPG
jgi:hypothetical protein